MIIPWLYHDYTMIIHVCFVFSFVLPHPKIRSNPFEVTSRVLWPINAPSSWKRTRPISRKPRRDQRGWWDFPLRLWIYGLFSPWTTGFYDDRWYTKPAQTYFYQKDIIGCRYRYRYTLYIQWRWNFIYLTVYVLWHKLIYVWKHDSGLIPQYPSHFHSQTSCKLS